MSVETPANICISPTFEAWRNEARRLLRLGLSPAQIDLTDTTAAPTLALQTTELPDMRTLTAREIPVVPKQFLEIAERIACYKDPGVWQLLYRILWRLQSYRQLLHDELDSDISTMLRMDAQIRRDIHKMHAFVRFRMVECEGAEHYIAWYRPDHRILRLTTPFFAERFTSMYWTILTEDESVSWNPEMKQAVFGPGTPRDSAPKTDELETLWRTYYGSIFNPARTNTRAMRSEMPVRYWANLPELDILPQLMQQADSRVEEMIRQQSKATANSFVPKQHTLPVLQNAISCCEGCDLFRHATQVVFGAGDSHVPLMLVGEQPGDEEDTRGEPFVGPAGRLLNRVLEEIGIDRTACYVTNAVKHFKFTQRGKLRLHQSPHMSEINACRPWLLAELDAVQPKVIVCLGASAAKSLLGAKFALMKQRGTLMESPYAAKVIATLHPSAVLRATVETRDELYTMLKQDLSFAQQTALEP